MADAIWGFPKLGVIFLGPYKKGDPTIWGFKLGVPCYCKPPFRLWAWGLCETVGLRVKFRVCGLGVKGLFSVQGFGV